MSTDPERQNVPPARVTVDVLKALRGDVAMNRLMYFNTCLSQPTYEADGEERRELLVDRMRRSGLAEIIRVVGDDVVGSPATLSSVVYSEDLIGGKTDPKSRFNREACVFSGLTVQNIDGGGDELLLRFFTRRNIPEDTYCNYLVRPADIEVFTSTPLLRNLQRAAEVTRDTVLTPDFFDTGKQIGPSQMDVLVQQSLAVGESIPPGAYQINCSWYVDMISYANGGEQQLIEEADELAGDLMSPTYAEYLWDTDPFKQFKTEADFWLGGGAPCLMIRDEFLKSGLYAIPIDAISSIRLINEFDYRREIAEQYKRGDS